LIQQILHIFTIPNQFLLDWSLIRASGSWHRLV